MSGILRSKLFAYGVVSTGLAAALISHVHNQRQNFYSAAVQMHRSTGSAIILGNFAAFLCILIGSTFKQIFFGTLRTIEVEHFYDKSWFFVTESMLALTFFRDDFNPPFIALFAILYFLRSFHWIAGDRIDYMDQIPAPGPSKLFHVRMVASLLFFLFWDTVSTYICLSTLILDKESLKKGTALGGLGGSSILFTAEFAITLARGLTVTSRYIINLVDLWRARGREDAPVWEGKSMCVSLVELVHDALRLVIYAVFFYTIFSLYGSIPLNHIHSLYSAFRSFTVRLRDLLKYRMATKNMDAKYPDATAEDIQGMGGESCVICREEMVPGSGRLPGRQEGPNDTPKKLACGHVFHFHCLRSWLERQQSCPTCRRTVLSNRPSPATRLPQAGQAAPAAPGAVPAVPAGPRPTGSTGSAAPASNTTTTQSTISLGAKAPPNGPIGLWPTSFGVIPQRRWPGVLPPQAYQPGPSMTVPGTPLPAATPLDSQAPQVFRPLGGPRMSSAMEIDREVVLPQAAATSSDSSQGVNQTPAQLAAAAAMRRLQKMAEKERRPIPAQELSTSNLSFEDNEPVEPRRKPYLVPAFTARAASALSFSVPMPALPTLGSRNASPPTPSNETTAQQIGRVNAHVERLGESLKNDPATGLRSTARLKELYALEQSVRKLVNEESNSIVDRLTRSRRDSTSAAPSATMAPTDPDPPVQISISDEVSPISSDAGEAEEDGDSDATVG